MPVSRQDLLNVLWRRGDTEFLLHAGQHKINDAFNNSTHTVFGVEISRQFGKTFWGVWLADKIARKNPGCSVRIGTAFYTDIEGLIVPSLRKVLTTCPEALRPRFYSQKGKYVYHNESEIGLVGLDKNPDKLRGNRLRIVLLEEAGFTNSEALRYIYDFVIVPAFTHEPLARVVPISTPPPEGNDHTFCELVDEAALKNSYIKLDVYQNPLLTPARIEEIAAELGGKDSIAFRREYLCERVVDSERAIIPEFVEKDHVVDRERPHYFSFLHQYEGLDSGVRDKTVVLFGYYDFPRGTVVIEDEFVLSGKDVTTRAIREGVIAIENSEYLKYLNLYRRISDNNNLILIQDLASEGLPFMATNKDSLPAMVNVLRLWFKDRRIEIRPKCKFTIGTIKSAVWDKVRGEFQRSKNYGHCDALAALMYLVRNIDQYTNPIPAYYTNPSRMPGVKGPDGMSPMGQDLKAIFSTLRA